MTNKFYIVSRVVDEFTGAGPYNILATWYGLRSNNNSWQVLPDPLQDLSKLRNIIEGTYPSFDAFEAKKIISEEAKNDITVGNYTMVTDVEYKLVPANYV